MICVLAILNSQAEENAGLTSFQRYVQLHFSELYHSRKIKKGEEAQGYNVQYGMIKLNWHLELQKLLLQTQKTFTLDKNKMNYLILSADNEAFTIISPANCTK